MSDKCSHHKDKKAKRFRRIFAGVLITLFVILVVVLLIWAILQPRKPRFVIQDATVFALNTSSPNVITTTLQITVLSRNPNDKIGVYYDKLDAYATYHDQQITLNTGIPPTYQGHKEVNIWSPFLSGVQVPVAPYNGLSLAQDQSMGVVKLIIKMYGRVRFKVGAFTSGHYRIYVKCPAVIPIGLGSRNTGIQVGSNTGIQVGSAMKYQLQQSCSVSV